MNSYGWGSDKNLLYYQQFSCSSPLQRWHHKQRYLWQLFFFYIYCLYLQYAYSSQQIALRERKTKRLLIHFPLIRPTVAYSLLLKLLAASLCNPTIVHSLECCFCCFICLFCYFYPSFLYSMCAFIFYFHFPFHKPLHTRAPKFSHVAKQ